MEILDSSPESLTQPHQIQMSADEEYSNDSYPMKYLFLRHQGSSIHKYNVNKNGLVRPNITPFHEIQRYNDDQDALGTPANVIPFHVIQKYNTGQDALETPNVIPFHEIQSYVPPSYNGKSHGNPKSMHSKESNCVIQDVLPKSHQNLQTNPQTAVSLSICS